MHQDKTSLREDDATRGWCLINVNCYVEMKYSLVSCTTRQDIALELCNCTNQRSDGGQVVLWDGPSLQHKLSSSKGASEAGLEKWVKGI